MSDENVSERLFLDTVHTDLVFIVENEEILGHRAAFATSCAYFEKLLYGDFKESKSSKVEITETSAKVFKELKRYIYLGHFNTEGWKIEDLLELLSVAHEYQYQKLFGRVMRALEKQPLDFDSWTLVNSAAATYDSASLKAKCASFAEAEVDNFLCLKNMDKMTDEFIGFMFDTPKIRSVNQDQLISCLLQWRKTHKSAQIMSVFQKICWNEVSQNVATIIAKQLFVNLKSEDEVSFWDDLADEIQVQSQWILKVDNVLLSMNTGVTFVLEKHDCNMFLHIFQTEIQISFCDEFYLTEIPVKRIEFELLNLYRIQKINGRRNSQEYIMDYKIVVEGNNNWSKCSATLPKAEHVWYIYIYCDFAEASEITLRNLVIY